VELPPKIETWGRKQSSTNSSKSSSLYVWPLVAQDITIECVEPKYKNPKGDLHIFRRIDCLLRMRCMLLLTAPLPTPLNCVGLLCTWTRLEALRRTRHEADAMRTVALKMQCSVVTPGNIVPLYVPLTAKSRPRCHLVVRE